MNLMSDFVNYWGLEFASTTYVARFFCIICCSQNEWIFCCFFHLNKNIFMNTCRSRFSQTEIKASFNLPMTIFRRRSSHFCTAKNLLSFASVITQILLVFEIFAFFACFLSFIRTPFRNTKFLTSNTSVDDILIQNMSNITFWVYFITNVQKLVRAGR